MFPGDESLSVQEQRSHDPVGQACDSDEHSAPVETVKPCCVATINIHAKFNPMMVCSECKHIIKCFLDEAAYNKYLIFCKSRKRQVAIGRVNEYHTIIFKSYDAFR